MSGFDVEFPRCGVCQRRTCELNGPWKASRDGKVVDAWCESCDEMKRIAEYNETGLLTTRLIMNASMWKYHATKSRSARTVREHILNLRISPPSHVPESAWTDYRHLLNVALKRLPLGAAISEADAEYAWERIDNANADCGVREHEFPVPQPRTYVKVSEAYDRIVQVVKDEYEPLVWFGGLQDFIRKETTSSHSCKLRDIEILSFCTAARAMQTISYSPTAASIYAGQSITLITSEDGDERCMGIQGLDATEVCTIFLLQRATQAWREGQFVMKADHKVGFG